MPVRQTYATNQNTLLRHANRLVVNNTGSIRWKESLTIESRISCDLAIEETRFLIAVRTLQIP